MDSLYPSWIWMSSRRPHSLSLQLAVPFALFVVLGSSGLAWWLHRSAREESRRVFESEARANAEFIRQTRLPVSERTAESLSRVLGVQVAFFRPSGEAMPPVVERAPKMESFVVPLDGEWRLGLFRPVEPRLAALLRPRTLVVLGVFWGLSFALAWVLARGLVRPLRLLAQRLPKIGHDPDATLPGAERADEIGQLARAYLDTRAQLAEERARREKAERLAILGRMATGLAHEIHNPLSAIRMHAQLLDSAPPAELLGAARDSLPVLLGETARIEGLVNQWMFLARPAPPETTLTGLGEIVDRVLAVQRPAAEHADVRLVAEIPRDFRAQIDARRITQAVGNVVINAIQAMPDGGTLTIRGEADAAGVRLIFRDTGRGFSDTALAQHAELFFSEKEGGMGIGLSVTVEVLRAHGGDLLVENTSNGALVTMQLPAPPVPVDQRSTINHQLA
jgi:signal transduction histidine kinase